MSNLPVTSNNNTQPSCLRQQINTTTSASTLPLQHNGILSPNSTATMTTALEHYRLSQIYQYALAAERLRCPVSTPSQSSTSSSSSTNISFQPTTMNVFRPDISVAAAAAAAAMPLLYNNPYYRLDPRLALYRPPEEPKPQHSYIGLIAMAILSSAENKLVLSDIYQYILDNYAYFRTRGPGWRNSIRHNLSLNDCFVKAGRSANGKGHYWAIHPANMDDFQKGDFRRRKAQRKVRRHMGLAVDDEDSPSPPPNSPPLSILRPPQASLNWPIDHQHSQFIPHHHHPILPGIAFGPVTSHNSIDFSLYNNNSAHVAKHFSKDNDVYVEAKSYDGPQKNINFSATPIFNTFGRNRKRQFDVASLLEPEMKDQIQRQVSPSSSHSNGHLDHEDNCSSSPVEISNNKSSSPSFHIQSDEEDEHQEDDMLADLRSKQDSKDKTDESEDSMIQIPLSKSPTPNISKGNVHRRTSISKKMLPGNSLRKKRRHHSLRHQSHSHSNSAIDLISDCDESNFNANNGSNSSSIRSACSVNPASNRTGANNNFLKDFPFVNNDQLFFATNQIQGNNDINLNLLANQTFFQQNPSLASLMILSSRYREMTLPPQHQPNVIKRP